MALAEYPLALLNLMEKDEKSATNPPLGIAKRIGSQRPIYDLPAHRFLLALISNAPSPDTIAKEFLKTLHGCNIPAVVKLGTLLLSLL